METNSGGPSRGEAMDALDVLAADRSRLAAGIRLPWPLLAGFGAVAAWWVGATVMTSPGEDYEPPAIGGPALALALVIVYLIHRETGVRFRNLGGLAGAALAGIAAGCLVLFSISLGLVSLGLPWAVAFTAAAAFALTTWLAGVAYRAAVQNLRHG